jgi:hypothetical protein
VADAAGPELVYVRWFDSAIYDGGAIWPDELSGYCENESAGLLVAESADSLTLALDRCLETGGLRLVLVVPRANIRSLRRFPAAPALDRQADPCQE